MNTLSWTILILASLVCLGLGFYFGLMPLNAQRMSHKQQKVSQPLSILAVGIVMLLVLTKQDLASWVVIAAMAAGFALAKVPGLRDPLRRRFPSLVPQEKPAQPSKTGQPAAAPARLPRASQPTAAKRPGPRR